MTERRWWVGSGGGSAGSAWHAGYLRARAEAGVQYAGAAGVSAGAFAATAVAMFRDLREAAAFFHERAVGITTGEIHKRHMPFGIAHALWDSAWRDSDPSIDLLRELVDPAAIRDSGKELRIGICALTQPLGAPLDDESEAPGAIAYFTVDESYVPLWEAVYCSAANPGVFRPRLMRKRWCVDGGVQAATPIAAAIAEGATHIDVSVAVPEAVRPMVRDPDDKLRTDEVLLRSLELATHRLTWVDVKYTQRINRLVALGDDTVRGKRYVHLNVTAPVGQLNDDPMRFDPNEAVEIAARGYEAALSIEADRG